MEPDMGQWDTRLMSPVVAFLQPLQAEAACAKTMNIDKHLSHSESPNGLVLG